MLSGTFFSSDFTDDFDLDSYLGVVSNSANTFDDTLANSIKSVYYSAEEMALVIASKKHRYPHFQCITTTGEEELKSFLALLSTQRKSLPNHFRTEWVHLDDVHWVVISVYFYDNHLYFYLFDGASNTSLIEVLSQIHTTVENCHIKFTPANIQKDTENCGTFAADIAFQLSKIENLHEELTKIEGYPVLPDLEHIRFIPLDETPISFGKIIKHSQSITLLKKLAQLRPNVMIGSTLGIVAHLQKKKYINTDNKGREENLSIHIKRDHLKEKANNHAKTLTKEERDKIIAERMELKIFANQIFMIDCDFDTDYSTKQNLSTAMTVFNNTQMIALHYNMFFKDFIKQESFLWSLIKKIPSTMYSFLVTFNIPGSSFKELSQENRAQFLQYAETIFNILSNCDISFDEFFSLEFKTRKSLLTNYYFIWDSLLRHAPTFPFKELLQKELNGPFTLLTQNDAIQLLLSSVNIQPNELLNLINDFPKQAEIIFDYYPKVAALCDKYSLAPSKLFELSIDDLNSIFTDAKQADAILKTSSQFNKPNRVIRN